jgi:hypothetical protein
MGDGESAIEIAYPKLLEIKKNSPANIQSNKYLSVFEVKNNVKNVKAINALINEVQTIRVNISILLQADRPNPFKPIIS